MKVSELGDCSMVIEKEPADSDEFTIGSMFEGKDSPMVKVFVPDISYEVYKVKEYIFNDDVLIVYMDTIPKEIKVGSHIGVKVGHDWYETMYDRTIKFCQLV